MTNMHEFCLFLQWFVFIDIWKSKQRQAFLNLPSFVTWFVIFGVSSYFNIIFNLMSYVFAVRYVGNYIISVFIYYI